MNSNILSRRGFLTALSLGSAHILLSNPLNSEIEAYAVNPLQIVKLGNTSIKTTLIGLGTGVHAGNRSCFLTKQEKSKSLALINQVWDKGIRFFDCADSYGSHDLVAEALKTKDREKYTLSSKIWVRKGGIPEAERPDANIVVDRLRKELKTDYIDLMQIHCMVNPNWTDEMKRQMDILSGLKLKGIIRAHGVSVHSLEAMKAALASPWVDVIHVRINPFGLAMDKPNPQEVVDVIHQLHNSGKGVIGMKLIGDGKLKTDSEKIDQALMFVLGLKSVDMMIIGFEQPEEVDNYLARVGKALKSLN
jgi:aryl-alcohol dehydrogenase-like predicted oxidoreductase